MDQLFNENVKRDSSENYYDILGCAQSSTIDQITTEFRKKSLLLHPDKNQDDEEAQKKFGLLLEAKETLTKPDLRNKYDQWLNSDISMPWREWLNFTQKNQVMFHWAFKKPDLTLPSSSKEENEQAADKTSTTTTASSDTSGSFQQREDSDMLRKFRNYEI